MHRGRGPIGLARAHAQQGVQHAHGLSAEVSDRTKLCPALALMTAPMLPVEPLHGFKSCLVRPPAESEKARQRLHCQRPLFRPQVCADAVGTVRTGRCLTARGARSIAQTTALDTMGQRTTAEATQRATTGIRRTSRATSKHCSWVGCGWRLAVSLAPLSAS